MVLKTELPEPSPVHVCASLIDHLMNSGSELKGILEKDHAFVKFATINIQVGQICRGISKKYTSLDRNLRGRKKRSESSEKGRSREKKRGRNN